MDFSASTVVAPVSPPAPKSVPDMRPTADVAASVRKTNPDLPVAMPSPPATSQLAAVSRSMMGEAAPVELDPKARISALSAVERTLKPYGISMLPQSAEEAADDARAEGARSKNTPSGGEMPEREKVHN